MALNGRYSADVPLRNCSLTHWFTCFRYPICIWCGKR